MPARTFPLWVATALLLICSYVFYEHGQSWVSQSPPVPGVEVVLEKQVVRGTLLRDGSDYVIEADDGQRVTFALKDAIMLTFPGPFPKDEEVDPSVYWRLLIPSTFLAFYIAFVIFWVLRSRRPS